MNNHYDDPYCPFINEKPCFAEWKDANALGAKCTILNDTLFFPIPKQCPFYKEKGKHNG